MGNFFKNIGTWFKTWVSTEERTVEAYAEHAWSLLEPFIEGAFTELEKDVIAAGKDLAVTAVQTVESQGLPTSEAKVAAFAAIMVAEAAKDGVVIATDLLNWLRENALQIFQSWQASQTVTGNGGVVTGGVNTPTPSPAV